MSSGVCFFSFHLLIISPNFIRKLLSNVGTADDVDDDTVAVDKG
jgi:hypothetical protein